MVHGTHYISHTSYTMIEQKKKKKIFKKKNFKLKKNFIFIYSKKKNQVYQRNLAKD